MSEISKTVIIGLGKGGGKILSALHEKEENNRSYHLVAIDTDEKDLHSCNADESLLLQQEWLGTHGCKRDIDYGDRAAEAFSKEIQEIIKDAEMIIVLAGLGGGTGGGVAVNLAKMVKHMDCVTLFLLTLPFSFEGNKVDKVAKRTLGILQQHSDSVIPVQNDTLFSAVPAEMAIADSFPLADKYMANVIDGLARISSADSLVETEFAEVKSMLSIHDSSFYLGVGSGSGDDAREEAIADFRKCPLMGGDEIFNDLDSAVVNIICRPELSHVRIMDILKSVEHSFPEETEVSVGLYTDKDLKEDVRITALTALNNKKEKHADPGHSSSVHHKPEKSDDASVKQGELKLVTYSTGIFTNKKLVMYKGENLDIPTFQRKNIDINLNITGLNDSDNN